MNPHLAAMYNTNGYGEAVQAEQTKIAHVDLFCKAAAAEGIDLSTMTEDVRAQLFENFCEKLASDDKDADDKGGDKDKAPPFMKKEDKGEKKEEKKEDDKEAKEAAARAEFLAQAEWQQKTAEADFLGRQMAHAFMAEKSEIEKEAKASVVAKAGEAARAVGKRLGEGAKKVGETADKNKGKAALVGGGVAAGAVGAALASRAKKDKEKDKSASALDLAAAEQGVKIAMEYGYDGDQATERLNAVLTLGPAESEKIAHAKGDYATALNLRGLELLEAAGYPIAWDDILG